MPDRRGAARTGVAAMRRAVAAAAPARVPAAEQLTPAGAATAADVRAAYRLLLGREPDPAGAALYEGRLRAGQLQARDVAAELVASPEFADRWQDLVVRSDARPREVAVDGFTIVVDEGDWAVGVTIARDADYEPDVSAQLRSLLQPGATMVDVGANIGWHALLGAAAVGPSGRVLAIEPNPSNGALIEQSRTVNHFDQLDVVVGALSDEPGWLALRTDGSNGAAVPLRAITPATRPEPCRFAVPAFRLDDLLEARGLVGEVDVVKIDVEGLETRVLRGAPKLLDASKPMIVFEWFPQLLRDDGEAAGAPLHLLRDLGYGIAVVGHPSAGERRPLGDEEIEAVRHEHDRQMLDLLAFPPGGGA